MVVPAVDGVVSENIECLVRRVDAEFDSTGSPSVQDIAAGLVYFHESLHFRGGGYFQLHGKVPGHLFLPL